MPDMFIEIDNIFPNFKNANNCEIDYFSKKIKSLKERDVLEFGVASAQTTISIATKNANRKIFAFDHFKGLEQSKQPLPPHAGWHKGAFRVGDSDYPHIPKTIDEVFKKVEPYKNINIIVEDVHELKAPSDYNIGKIVAINIDVDIYEPTVSVLNFIDKCMWDELYIRFDDWHGHDPQFDYHERLACKQWLERNSYKYDIPENGHAGGVLVWR